MNAAVSRMRARIAEWLPYLAWVAFLFALTGGVLLPGTEVGHVLTEWVESITWSWVAALAFCGSIFGLCYDIARDAIPDRFAIYSAALAPTMAGGVSGDMAGWVSDFSNWVASWSVERMESLSGLESAGGVALFALGMALVIARRTTKDRKSAGSRHHGHGAV